MQGITIFEDGPEIKVDQVIQVGSIEVFGFDGNLAVDRLSDIGDREDTSTSPEDIETMIHDCISLAEEKGLTEIANYLELADEAEISELLSPNPTNLYHNLIEHGYAALASQLRQNEVELTPKQVILLNTALIVDAPYEVLALTSEWAPETTSSPDFQPSIMGNPTTQTTLRAGSILRAIK